MHSSHWPSASIRCCGRPARGCQSLPSATKSESSHPQLELEVVRSTSLAKSASAPVGTGRRLPLGRRNRLCVRRGCGAIAIAAALRRDDRSSCDASPAARQAAWTAAGPARDSEQVEKDNSRLGRPIYLSGHWQLLNARHQRFRTWQLAKVVKVQVGRSTTCRARTTSGRNAPAAPFKLRTPHGLPP